ncbi:hypothetical protein RUM44_007262 [Polyplax serrata]|uniref:Uncharacterized protein n=1 Tax=Polyplax serrata TaxID=468196 RepID=A0ABR1B070_POLSC
MDEGGKYFKRPFGYIDIKIEAKAEIPRHPRGRRNFRQYKRLMYNAARINQIRENIQNHGRVGTKKKGRIIFEADQKESRRTLKISQLTRIFPAVYQALTVTLQKYQISKKNRFKRINNSYKNKKTQQQQQQQQ